MAAYPAAVNTLASKEAQWLGKGIWLLAMFKGLRLEPLEPSDDLLWASMEVGCQGAEEVGQDT